MLVEIYSDVVCPWCYIGKRRFEKALAGFDGADDVTVVWKPYQLDPTAPPTPTPVREAYARKFGGPDAAAQIIDRVTSVAAGEGLDFRLDRALRANTFDAHRLMWRHPDVDLEEPLMRAYFIEGRNVADHGVLADIAAEAGLDRDDIVAFLASDEGRAEVRAELEAAVDQGITAVPTFVFEGRFSVPGAQDPDTMLLVLQRVAERLSPT